MNNGADLPDDDYSDRDEEIVAFDIGVNPMRSISAVRNMVEQMIAFAASSPDAYFDIDEIAGYRDGTLRLSYLGRDFQIRIDLVGNDGAPVPSPRVETLVEVKALRREVAELRELIEKQTGGPRS